MEEAPTWDDEAVTYDRWLAIGLKMGWCGPSVCLTHDGAPTSAAEDEEFEQGDPCVHILRLYTDEETRQVRGIPTSPTSARDPA